MCSERTRVETLLEDKLVWAATDLAQIKLTKQKDYCDVYEFKKST